MPLTALYIVSKYQHFRFGQRVHRIVDLVLVTRRDDLQCPQKDKDWGPAFEQLNPVEGVGIEAVVGENHNVTFQPHVDSACLRFSLLHKIGSLGTRCFHIPCRCFCNGIDQALR